MAEKHSAVRVEPERLLEVITAFNSQKDYYTLLETILVKMMELTNADGGTLYVLEDGKLNFRIIRTISLNVYKSAGDVIDLPPIELNERNIVNVSAYAAITKQIVEIDDVYDNEDFNFSGPRAYDKLTGYRTRSMLVLPLTSTTEDEEEVIGVIQLINAVDRNSGLVTPFGDVYNPPVLPALANISANTLANVMYLKEIQEFFHSFVRVMTQAIDERTPYNANHTNNVARYCGDFAAWLAQRFPKGQALHFDKHRTEQLVMSAFLHDIGKIATPLTVMDKPDRLGEALPGIRYRFQIKRLQLRNQGLSEQGLDEALALIEECNTAGFLPPDKIERLQKLSGIFYEDEHGGQTPLLSDGEMMALTVVKGTLTEAERAIMQEHASVTGRLLNKMSFEKYYKDVAGWAGSHHELLDGSGYPQGLKGEQITAEIAILTIADIYDALTARDRPYKKAMPAAKALDILRSMAEEGKLDRELVGLFSESEVWRGGQHEGIDS